MGPKPRAQNSREAQNWIPCDMERLFGHDHGDTEMGICTKR
jgi:hypothetical protein